MFNKVLEKLEIAIDGVIQVVILIIQQYIIQCMYKLYNVCIQQHWKMTIRDLNV